MKLLGLVGGTSWVSTAEYYAHLNRLVNNRQGGDESAKLILWSLNFAEVRRNNDAGNLAANGVLIVDAAKKLAEAGAKGIVLCANTMHMFALDVESATGIPVIHIAHAVADEINRLGFKKVFLLGTKYTMEMPFYTDILSAKGIEVVTPGAEDRAWVNARIFDEMTKDVFTDATKAEYMALISQFAGEGCDAVIMGCTEIPLLLAGCELAVPGIDTALIHCQSAVEFAGSE